MPPIAYARTHPASRNLHLLARIFVAASLAACGAEAPTPTEGTWLRVSSQAPTAGGRLDTLVINLWRDGVRYPRTAGGLVQPLAGQDPVAAPILVKVDYAGQTFGDGAAVRLEVVGRAGEAPATRFEGALDLGADGVMDVRLAVLPTGCDADSDGALDCSIDGCCSNDSPFGDCAGGDPTASPWGTEAACEPCDDTVDQDCDGADVPCVDVNASGVADCAETCSTGGAFDATEVCDSRDNDCDGASDEGFALDGAEVGEACAALGACGEGVVECGEAGEVVCSTRPGGSEHEGGAEVCNGRDDDCDGETDESPTDAEAANCRAAGVCALGEVKATCEAGAWRCDYAAVPGFEAVESACDGRDNDCDGEADEGHTLAVDGDAPIALGVVCDGSDADACKDGVVACSADARGVTCVEAADDAGELCNGLDDDCDGETDEDFGPDGQVTWDGAPGTGDNGRHLGQRCGVGACAGGTVVCAPGGTALTCSSLTEASTETCNGADDDCDGAADDGLPDLDGDGLSACVDIDDDGDGRLDGFDGCPAGATGWTSATATDRDGDGCRDTDEDPDDDGDGIGDAADRCDPDAAAGDQGPDGVLVGATGWTSTARSGEAPGTDYDSDGCRDQDEDTDDDGDGLADGADQCDPDAGGGADPVTASDLGWQVTPLEITGTPGTDFDGDGCRDAGEDTDDDADGKADDTDLCDPDAREGDAGAGGVALSAKGWSRNTGSTLAATDYDDDGCRDDDEDSDDDGDGVGDASDRCDPDALSDDARSASERSWLSTPESDYNGNGCRDGRSEEPDQDSDTVLDGADGCDRSRLGFTSTLDADFDGDGCEDATEEADQDGDRVPDDLGAPACDSGITARCDDNCVAVANADQRDTDDDDAGDACDTDDDGDSVPDTHPSGTICRGGATTACGDNCALIANTTQVDVDRDAKGDACDTACLYGPSPFEVCGDCLDNDCDGLIDESGCAERRVITVLTDAEPVAVGYPVRVSVDHANLVAAGLSLASGDDLRVFFRDDTAACDDTDPSACHTELDRVADPATGFGQREIGLWFSAQAAIDANSTSVSYELYYTADPEGAGMLDAPLDAGDAIFTVFDDFEAATLDPAWVQETGSGTFSATAGGLTAPATGAIRRAIPQVTGLSETLTLAVGMNWVPAGDPDWTVGLQLGDASRMRTAAGDPDYPNEGAGGSAGWYASSQPASATDVPRFAAIEGGLGFPAFLADAWDVEAPQELGLTVSLAGAGEFNLTHDGALTTGLPLVDQTVTRLDTLRLLVLGASAFSTRSFDYVTVRPAVSTGLEPVGWLGLAESLGTGTACTLSATGRVLNFRIDGSGSVPTDSSPTGLSVSRTAGTSGSPTLGLLLNQGLARFSNRGESARYQSVRQSAASALVSALQGATAVTFEAVSANLDQTLSTSLTRTPGWIAALNNEDGTVVMALGYYDADTVTAEVSLAQAGSVVWRWDGLPAAWERAVLHLTLNATAASPDDRLTLHVDGVRRQVAFASGPVPQGDTLSVVRGTSQTNEALFALGNLAIQSMSNENYTASVAALVHRFAAYTTALDPATRARHVRLLLKDDDLP